MSLFLQYADAAPEHVLQSARDFESIAHQLERLGVGFERWSARVALAADSSADQILEAYAPEIERLKRSRGYRSADVVRLKRDPSDPEWSQKARVARGKFLDEHTHAEDEVRFFVEGSGIFYLHMAGCVSSVLCERGDLLSVPAGTRHWFDMGSEPAFCAIRLFGNETGWIANFTGDKLAAQFPSFDSVIQATR
jgi:1,2-dihydroxy-3-keto-5-methylthiopentene dioxygenase